MEMSGIYQDNALGLLSGGSLSSPSISRLKTEERSGRKSLTATFIS